MDLVTLVKLCNSHHGLTLRDANEETDVGTRHGVSLRDLCIPAQENKFGNTIPGSLSAIIGQFKSTLTRWCNMNNYPFMWQVKFYDHVIRNQDEYERIENYIINNVSNWESDKFYSDGA